jgi:hypothetical protein
VSAPANPARGEAALSLQGETLLVRPSFQALVAAEGELGPLFALVEKAAAGGLTLGEMVTLIFHCLADRPEGLDRETLGERIADAGIALLMPVVRSLLQQILKGR